MKAYWDVVRLDCCLHHALFARTSGGRGCRVYGTCIQGAIMVEGVVTGWSARLFWVTGFDNLTIALLSSRFLAGAMWRVLWRRMPIARG